MVEKRDSTVSKMIQISQYIYENAARNYSCACRYCIVIYFRTQFLSFWNYWLLKSSIFLSVINIITYRKLLSFNEFQFVHSTINIVIDYLRLYQNIMFQFSRLQKINVHWQFRIAYCTIMNIIIAYISMTFDSFAIFVSKL